MNKIHLIVAALLIKMFVLSSLALSATGSIRGKITDSESSEALPGANVSIEGTALGSATNLDGEYVIRRVPTGAYTLVVTFIGYQRQTVSVQVTTDTETQQDFSLSFQPVRGEEVVVTAQLEGQAAAINRQLTSRTITNVVSAERIQELPDANAAESVGRLPGISIKRDGGEGQKIVVRGLAPTYNTITINGEQVPATDLQDRSVDLNMISPEILAGIEVTKALTADQDANSFGGTVDFQLADAPGGGFRSNIRFQSGYNDQQGEFGQYKGSAVISNRFFDERFGILVAGNLERAQRGSDQLSASYGIQRAAREGEERAPIQISDLSLVDRDETRQRYGGSVLLDYKLDNGSLRFSNFISRLDRNEFRRYNNYLSGSNWHEYRIRDRLEQVDVLSNSFGGEHSLPFAQIDWSLARSTSLRRHPFDNQIRFQQKSAFDTRRWTDEMGPDLLVETAVVDIPNTFLYQGEQTPERKYERNLAAQTSLEIPYTFGKHVVGSVKLGGRLVAKSADRNREMGTRRFDLPYGTDIFARNHSRYREPGFEFLGISGADDASILNYLDSDFDAEHFLDGHYDFGIGVDRDELMFLTNAVVLDSMYRTSAYADIDDFELTERVSAAYIMAEINLGPDLMILPGLRYENTHANMTGREATIAADDVEPDLEEPTITDTTATNTYGRWFPQMHIRYKVTDWFDVRVARTRSISRPRLDWMLPKRQVNGSAQTVIMGRPDLKPQVSTNYDVFLSFYGNRIGLLTIGGFKKTITDLIFNRAGKKILNAVEEGFDPTLQGLTLDRPENNIFETDAKGFEIEWQTNFTWLPRPLDGLVLNVNYTYLSSETRYPRSFVLTEQIPVFPFIRQSVIDTFRVGNMIDQADDIANIAIGYDKGPFSARLAMLYQGTTLTQVGEQSELDGFTDDYIRWDLSMKLDLNRRFSLLFNWNNISNGEEGSFQQLSRFPTSREVFGWTTDIGLRYTL
jgi:TonB-dependent receptor